MDTRVLVTGASGTVGTHVIGLLAAAGADVRALTHRTPVPGVPSVRGDLCCPDTLSTALADVDAMLLCWPWHGADPDRLAEAVTAAVRRVVFLCPRAAGPWSAVADALCTRDPACTVLRAAPLAGNALLWAPQVRTGVVRWPHRDAARAPVHEADVAAVAARVLTEPGHEGAAYELTGPQVLTVAEQVAVLARALGRPVEYADLSVTAARAHLLACGWSAHGTEDALAGLAEAARTPETVTGTVAAVTGAPARSFAAWAAEHVARFR